jgi:DNA polymerase I
VKKKDDSDTNRFVAIDANSLVHRAFHAFPPDLETTDGTQVNAVYGFTSMLLRVLADLDPKYLLCAFDMKAPTFRHTEYSDYKATRKPTDHTLIDQFPLVKEVLDAFNVPILEKEGYEADDILGTLAGYVESGKWSDNGLEMIIVTGDKDLLQMAGDKVSIWLPRGGFKDMRMYDPAEVEKLFGFGPEYIVDYKALVGDASDNIPGVKGVGDKTAKDLIRTYGHLDDIFKNLDSVTGRAQKLLSEGEENAEMSRKLAQILTDVDLEVKLEDCLMRDFQKSEVMDVFQRMEFRSLMAKIPESINGDDGEQIGLFSANPEDPGDGEVEIGDFAELAERIGDIEDAVCVYDNSACIIGVPAQDDQWDIYFASDLTGGDDREVLEDLLVKDIRLVTYGWEQLIRNLYDAGIDRAKRKKIFMSAGRNVFDISLAAYHLSTGQRDYSLKNLAFAYAGEMIPDEGVGRKSDAYAAVAVVSAVGEKLQEEFESRELTMGKDVKRAGKPIDRHSWKEIDFPMTLAMSAMSEAGVCMDRDALESKQKELRGRIEELESEIYESIGHEFNINSSRQLADVLFEELELPVQKKRKTGPSTDESVLQKLRGLHPCIEPLLEYREVVKMENTYVTPLLEHMTKSEDGRIHSEFTQVGTTTGRLASREPNLQNIPVRSDLGREIRDMFIAGDDNMLVSADYSQIDLRVMAHFSQDPLMLEDFAEGKDFHKATAARIFGKKEEHVSKKDRRIAKTINFGVLYGLSAFGLSETLDIEMEEARTYIDSYFEKYDGIRHYLDDAIEKAHENGFVETSLGRRRYIGGLKTDNQVRKAASEREAINLPIQGTAADIMRAAMDDVYAYVLETGKADLVLQIHDEFLLECGRTDAADVARDVADIMMNAFELTVPLEVHVLKGKTLASMKPVS